MTAPACDGQRLDARDDFVPCRFRDSCARYRRYLRVPWAERPYVMIKHLIDTPAADAEECEHFQLFTRTTFDQ